MRGLTSAVLVVVVMLAPSVAFAAATNYTDVVDWPIDGTVYCDGREIALDGNMRLKSHWTIDDIGTMHLHTLYLMYNTRGLDQFGEAYRVVSTHPQIRITTHTDWAEQDIVLADANHAQFISKGSGPNFDMSWSVHYTYNHHAELVAFRLTYDLECYP